MQFLKLQKCVSVLIFGVLNSNIHVAIFLGSSLSVKSNVAAKMMAYVSTDFTNRCLCHTIQHTGWNSLHQLYTDSVNRREGAKLHVEQTTSEKRAANGRDKCPIFQPKMPFWRLTTYQRTTNDNRWSPFKAPRPPELQYDFNVASAMVLSCLDYSNSPLFGCSVSNTAKLQHIQNTAVRIVLNTITRSLYSGSQSPVSG